MENNNILEKLTREDILKRIRVSKERKRQSVEKLKEDIRQRFIARVGMEPDGYEVF